MSIDVSHVSKTFGSFRALDDISLSVPTGELVALLGPSGSGKTSLLRIIAGFERPDAGSGAIRFHGEDVTTRPVSERQVGFVFQHYALFRHMSVHENVAFGLRVRPRKVRPPAREIDDRVRKLLALVQLEGLGDRYPGQISGGQRQRVALARALAVEPKLLLLDEPFGALDAKVRQDLRRWLRRLHDELHVTSVFVTHDQEEALEVADRLVVMHKGRIEQIGSTDELYEHPATPFVFDFLGDTNILPDGDRDIYVRPGDLRLAEPGADGVDVRILEVQRTGPRVRATAVTQAGGVSLTMELPHLHHDVARIVAGARVRLRLMQFSVFPRKGAS